MAAIISLNRGNPEEENQVVMDLFRLGRDFLLVIGGGDSHIGALAVSDKNRGSENFQYELIHHKEALVVEMAMKILKDLLPGELLVVGGIHYNGISKEKIKEIVTHCQILLEEMSKKIISILGSC